MDLPFSIFCHKSDYFEKSQIKRRENLAAVWGPTLGQPGSCMGPNVGTTWQLCGAQRWDNLAAVWGPTLGQPGSCVGPNVGTTWQLCGAQRWDNLAAVWGPTLGQPGSCVGRKVGTTWQLCGAQRLRGAKTSLAQLEIWRQQTHVSTRQRISPKIIYSLVTRSQKFSPALA